MARKIRNLILVLGDQLDQESSAFDDFDSNQDQVWMAEVAEESTHVWSHRARIVLFLSAMRHFREWLLSQGHTVHYRNLDDRGNQGSLSAELSASVGKLAPAKLILTEPGDFRVLKVIQEVAARQDVELEIRADRHFFCSNAEFREHAEGRKQLRMEYFYRELRKRTGILMDQGKPTGGKWNYDTENRESFKREGPVGIEPAVSFAPDTITRKVIELVERNFPDHPGNLQEFDWPVTSEDALVALDDFIEHRLPEFGKYQDAMWTDEPILNHSLLSTSMNLKLLDPRIVIAAAESAYRNGSAPLESVEGFIRQILGWREYVRGVYWLLMPGYIDRNELNATADLPEFYWDGKTEMNCLAQSIGQTLEYGYAHHIQRLMVTGLFSLLLGVDPKQVHQWYLAVYVDAVEWVELPNTLGMSQYADGGVMASKPYVASGKYIQRMSNYCADCRFNPANSIEEDACPFTTLYWDFLQRHEDQLQGNNRMTFQLKNLQRKSPEQLEQIRAKANEIRQQLKPGQSPAK